MVASTAAQKSPFPRRKPRPPYMGWNSYYALSPQGKRPSQDELFEVARSLETTGLRAAGYNIIWIDGEWARLGGPSGAGPRDAAGELVPDPSLFPDGFPRFTAELHARGFRAGIYTDAGNYEYGVCGVGSGGHYAHDARQIQAWGFDALKIDFLCGINQSLDPGAAYEAFSMELSTVAPDMIINVCNPAVKGWPGWEPGRGADNTYRFGPRIADSWRTGTDIANWFTDADAAWAYVLRSLDANLAQPQATSSGSFNDPDYLIPMRPTEDGTPELGFEQSRAQFLAWVIMQAPLILSADPRLLSKEMIAELCNPEAISLSAEERLTAAAAIQSDESSTVIASDLASKTPDGRARRAVLLLNRTGTPYEIQVTSKDLGLSGPVELRDVGSRAPAGTFTNSIRRILGPHQALLLTATGAEIPPGDSRGGIGHGPAAVWWGNKETLAVFGADDRLWLSEGGTKEWTSLRDPGVLIKGTPALHGTQNRAILSAVARGIDNGVYLRERRNGNWDPWLPLGGKITTDPAVLWATNSLRVIAARGNDGQIWCRWGNDLAWKGLGSPAGDLSLDGPSLAADSTSLYLFLRGTDNALWMRTAPLGGEAWSGWTSLGGSIASTPAATSTGGTITVLCHGRDGTIWQCSKRGSGAWNWKHRDEFPRYSTGSRVSVSAIDATSIAVTGASSDASIWLRQITL